MSYKWVTTEMVKEKLEEILGEMTGESILMIPGLFEIASEHFNNEILEELGEFPFSNEILEELEAEHYPDLMSYEAVNESFKSLIEECKIPLDDEIMLREEWNNYTDSLCKDKLITPDNYEDWDNPY